MAAGHAAVFSAIAPKVTSSREVNAPSAPHPQMGPQDTELRHPLQQPAPLPVVSETGAAADLLASWPGTAQGDAAAGGQLPIGQGGQA